MLYELFYLVRATHESDLEKIKKDVENTVTENEGVFEELEISEKKRLAYKIQHETYGFYVARRFEIAPEKISEINRKLNLYPGVLRFMISKSSDLPELKIKDKEAEREKKYYPASPGRFRDKKESARGRPVTVSEEEKADKKTFSRDEKKADDDIDKKLEEILNI